ncbi:MAG: hypothetical protein ACLVLH_23465 [Eisenbergiella massiliensis]
MINAFKAVGNDGTGQKWLKVQAVMAASGLLPAGGAAVPDEAGGREQKWN